MDVRVGCICGFGLFMFCLVFSDVWEWCFSLLVLRLLCGVVGLVCFC